MIPLLLNLKGKKVLVVGAGPIARRRMVTLLEAGALVTCVTLAINQEFEKIVNDGLTIEQRQYQSSDLDDMTLVVAATNDQELNARIKSDCQIRSLLCNRVDCHQDSDVVFPCVIRRGKLSLSVCTEGASPTLTKAIVKSLSQTYDESYIERLELLSHLREQILRDKKPGYQALLSQIAEESLDGLRKKVKEMGEINDN